MKRFKNLTAAALILTFALGPTAAMAADKKAEKSAKNAKPYPLNTCIVSGEKLGGDMGEPYVFTHNGQEIKLCCKSCKKDFDKEPAKYLKKLNTASNTK